MALNNKKPAPDLYPRTYLDKNLNVVNVHEEMHKTRDEKYADYIAAELRAAEESEAAKEENWLNSVASSKDVVAETLNELQETSVTAEVSSTSEVLEVPEAIGVLASVDKSSSGNKNKKNKNVPAPEALQDESVTEMTEVQPAIDSSVEISDAGTVTPAE